MFFTYLITYYCTDVLFQVNISLGPLLTQDPPGSIDGWFPIYDTMHGIYPDCGKVDLGRGAGGGRGVDSPLIVRPSGQCLHSRECYLDTSFWLESRPILTYLDVPLKSL